MDPAFGINAAPLSPLIKAYSYANLRLSSPSADLRAILAALRSLIDLAGYLFSPRLFLGLLGRTGPFFLRVTILHTPLAHSVTRFPTFEAPSLVTCAAAPSFSAPFFQAAWNPLDSEAVTVAEAVLQQNPTVPSAQAPIFTPLALQTRAPAAQATAPY